MHMVSKAWILFFSQHAQSMFHSHRGEWRWQETCTVWTCFWSWWCCKTTLNINCHGGCKRAMVLGEWIIYIEIWWWLSEKNLNSGVLSHWGGRGVFCQGSHCTLLTLGEIAVESLSWLTCLNSEDPPAKQSLWNWGSQSLREFCTGSQRQSAVVPVV